MRIRPPRGGFGRSALLLPLVLLVNGSIPAAPVADAGDTLRVTWNDCQPLVEAHPRLAAARASVQAAAGAVREAAALPNPEGDLRLLSVDPRHGGEAAREEEFALGLPLDWIWTRPGRLSSARAGEALAAVEAELVTRELTLELAEAFWVLAGDQARAATLDDLDRHMQDLRRAIAIRVQLGESRPVEAARIDVEALRQQAEADAARRALELSRRRLAQWLPAAAGVPLVVETDIFQLPAPPDEGAPGEHARLRAAQASIRAERGALAAERAGLLPRLELHGSLERADDRLARGVGLTLDLPLFNWNRGRIGQARARLREAQAGLDEERRRLAMDLAEAESACGTSLATARSYRDEILPRAEEAALALEKGWRLGEANLFELIDARRLLGSIRREAIEACVQAQVDRLRLGMLLEKEIY
ncbi:MAG: TolC family protein [bacterium]|nr:TolC family protein [bacterium]